MADRLAFRECNILDYLDGPNVIPRVLENGRRRQKRSERFDVRRIQHAVADFDDGGGWPGARECRSLYKLEKARKPILLRASREEEYSPASTWILAR